MFTVFGGQTGSLCNGTTRRNLLQAGSLGLGGLAAAPWLSASEQRKGDSGAVIMVYLPGGPTQHETFDPKPDAPSEIRGSFGPISTKIPGIQFCELLPELSSLSDKFSVVRTLHRDAQSA